MLLLFTVLTVALCLKWVHFCLTGALRRLYVEPVKATFCYSAETLYYLWSVFTCCGGLPFLSVTARTPLDTVWCQGETLPPAAAHMQLHPQLWKHESVFLSSPCSTRALCLKRLVLCIMSYFSHIRITSGALCIYSGFCCLWQQYKTLIKVHYLAEVMGHI